MKKKIITTVIMVLAIALSLALLTSCDLFGAKDDSGDKGNSGTTTKTLTEQECKDEIAAASTTTLAQKSFTVSLTDDANKPPQQQSSCLLEVDGDNFHYQLSNYNSQTDSRMEEDVYYYKKGGQFYTATKTNGLYVEAQITETVYNEMKSSYELSVLIGSDSSYIKLTPEGATVAYNGTKIGNKTTIQATGETTLGTQKHVTTLSVEIENGLFTELSYAEVNYENGMPSIGTKMVARITYGTTITLPEIE